MAVSIKVFAFDCWLLLLASTPFGCYSTITSAKANVNVSSRPKRALIYPPASTLLVIFGVGTPLQLERESVLVGAFGKFIYRLPNNSSYVELARTSSSSSSDERAKKKTNRRSVWSVYKSLARLAELYGFGDGRSCVLRTICEAASAPFRASQGLLHALLRNLLAPSRSAERYDEYADREYQAAEDRGKSHADAPQDNCHALYPECRRSVLDVFSDVLVTALT